VAGPGREEPQAARLQVPQRPPPDVRLGDLLDVYGGLDPGVYTGAFKSVLLGDGVHHRSQHADVVGGSGIHVATVLGPAPEVAPADYQGQMNAAALGRGDLLGKRCSGLGRDSEPRGAGEELT